MGKERRERRALTNGSSETPSGIDNTARRTWNKEDYAEKAADREAKVGAGACGNPMAKRALYLWKKASKLMQCFTCASRKSKMRRVHWTPRKDEDLVSS